MDGKFHLALSTENLEAMKAFYEEKLHCSTGRTGPNWADYEFFGHQLTIQQVAQRPVRDTVAIPGGRIPCDHFGVVLEVEEWEKVKDFMENEGIQFLVQPHTAFEGEVGEQQTFLIQDPDGNAIEFKAFEDPEALFEQDYS